ncbi:DnaA ATPase domain-containing protein [Lactococcus lactis]|uniref:DnaA ATPase domain-containing protein n=1 Tax=Lactococcus lactis TaxID=1358 RepID=UPI0032E4EC09
MQGIEGLVNLSEKAMQRVEQAEAQARQVIFSDEEVTEFIANNEIADDVIEKHLCVLTSYIRQRHSNKQAGYQLTLRYHEGLIIHEYRKTDQRRQQEHEQNTSAVLNRNSIVPDKNMLKATFDNFKWTNDFEKDVLKKAYDIARRYLAGETFNTIFKGTAGAGKSHLAMAIARYVNEQSRIGRIDKRILFLDVNELFRRLKSSINNPHTYWSEQNVMTLIRSADLVILDDLGSESTFTGKELATDYVQRILFAIVNTGQSIITTTNLEDPNLVYNSKIVSRLGSKSQNSVVNFNGIKDKR